MLALDDHSPASRVRMGIGFIKTQHRRDAGIDVLEQRGPVTEVMRGDGPGNLRPSGDTFVADQMPAFQQVRPANGFAEIVPELDLDGTDGEMAMVGGRVDAVACHAAGQVVSAARRHRPAILQ